MTKHRQVGAFLTTLLLASLAIGQRERSPDVQLKAAMHKELVEGDLPGAIKVYREVVSHPDASREVIARALLQIGLCHEKLGDVEARDVYRKLISGYPEQAREVAVARQRLAALAKALAELARKPRFRKIETPTRLLTGTYLSPDGQSLAFAGGGIWVMPVPGKVGPNIAGVPVRLADLLAAWGEVVWSADGKWIAFNASGGMYVIPSVGGAPRKVMVPEGFERAAGEPYDTRLSLSPDGTKLAYRPGEGEGLYLIPVAGGAPELIAGGSATQPAFSPDGNRIAYVTVEPAVTKKVNGRTEREVRSRVWVRSLDRNDPVLVADELGYARGPIWSPDGRMIAFLHGPSSANTQLHIAPLDGTGGPAAPATRIELPSITYHLLAGWTPDNKIGLLINKPAEDAIYRVPATGGLAALISPKDRAAHPRWSPDGRRIYFRWDGGEIASVAADGGGFLKVLPRSKRVLPVLPGSGNDPSPDGLKLVFGGAARKPPGTWNLWTVSTGGGEPEQVTDVPRSSGLVAFPCWSPDGASIAFVKIVRGEGPNIYLIPADGGQMRRLTSVEDKVSWAGIAWSPDGKNIAYFSTDRTLNLIPATGGDSRVVVRLQPPVTARQPFERGELRHNEMAWTPDGKKLAFTYEGIQVVTLDSGTVRGIATGLPLVNPTYLDWSPDGKTIAFTGHAGGDSDFYLIEDFLSLLKQ